MEVSNSAAAYAYQGMQDGFNRLADNSQQLANPNNVNKTEPLVELKQNETQVQASAKSFKSYDEMIGTLIDIMA